MPPIINGEVAPSKSPGVITSKHGHSLPLQHLKTYRSSIEEKLRDLRKSSVVIESPGPATQKYSLIYGDDYSKILASFIDATILKSKNGALPKFMLVSVDKCPPILSRQLSTSNYGPPGANRTQERLCQATAEAAMSAILVRRPTAIVIASRWQDYMFGSRSVYEMRRSPAPLLPLNDAMKRVSQSLQLAKKSSDKVRVFGTSALPAARHSDMSLGSNEGACYI